MLASVTASTQVTPATTKSTPSIRIIKICRGAIMKATGDGLTDLNWVTWQVWMMSLLVLCEVEPYMCSEIEQPNKDADPFGHANWKKIYSYSTWWYFLYAWKNLEAIYEDKSQETAVVIIQNLWHTTAEEDNDINEYLIQFKKYWEHLNLVIDESF